MTLCFGSRIMYNVTIKAHRRPYFGKLGDMQLHRLEHLNFGSFQSLFFFFLPCLGVCQTALRLTEHSGGLGVFLITRCDASDNLVPESKLEFGPCKSRSK